MTLKSFHFDGFRTGETGQAEWQEVTAALATGPR